MIKFYRGPRNSYSLLDYGSGIYFATDTQEIIQNGLSYSGQIPSDLIERIELNELALLILTGDGEGSVLNLIDLAIEDFATKITDNGTIDTFKELLDFAASNKSEVDDLIVTVNSLEQKSTEQDEKISNLETCLDNVETFLDWETVD